MLMCSLSGVVNGLTMTFIKVSGEVFNSDEFSDNIFFTLFVGILGISGALLTILFLNLSMKYYNNLDVMPIYMSVVLMGMMGSGLIILNESALYTWIELCLLFGSAFVVIAGIFLLTKKQSMVLIQDQED